MEGLLKLNQLQMEDPPSLFSYPLGLSVQVMDDPMAFPPRPVRIVIVEDNTADFVMFMEGIKRLPFTCEVDCFDTGIVALKYLLREPPFEHAKRPDLLVLDWNLPSYSGGDVLRILREKEITKNLPVVVFTSSSSERDILEAYEACANCYVRKPYEAEGFISAVMEIGKFWFCVSIPPSFYR